MNDSSIEVIARGVLLHADRVLLCQNRKHGHIFLPGGHVEFDEPAERSLIRETMEEVGLPVTIGKLMGVCESAFDQPRKSGGMRRHHEINLIFQMHPKSDSDIRAIQSQEDHIQFIWRSLADLAIEPAILPRGVEPFILAARQPAISDTGWLSDMT